jgi:hypothetical protein
MTVNMTENMTENITENMTVYNQTDLMLSAHHQFRAAINVK